MDFLEDATHPVLYHPSVTDHRLNVLKTAYIDDIESCDQRGTGAAFVFEVSLRTSHRPVGGDERAIRSTSSGLPQSVRHRSLPTIQCSLSAQYEALRQ